MFEAVLMTETVCEPVFVTYANGADTGVTVIIAVIGLPLVFFAVKELMFPVPLAGKPIAGVLLVQL